MGKYGNCVSIAEVIRLEKAEVEKILDRNAVNEEDRKAVIDALMEMAYQWANANAWSCVLSESLEKNIGKNNAVLKSVIFGRLVDQKMREYYPLFIDTDEEEECQE